MIERWNGRAWSVQAAPKLGGPESNIQLLGVSCTSRTACTAVGSIDPMNLGFEKRPLVERWNGSWWSIQNTPTRALLTSSLSSVSCASRRSCVAVGIYWTSNMNALALRWDGRRWSRQQTSPIPGGPLGSELTSVSCSTDTMCNAVGDWGRAGDNTLVEAWDGSRWSRQKIATPAGARPPLPSLNGVSCTSGTTCTLAGTYFTSSQGDEAALIERWDGSRWSIPRTRLPSRSIGSELFGISCTPSATCIAVGSSVNNKPTTDTFRPLVERSRSAGPPTFTG